MTWEVACFDSSTISWNLFFWIRTAQIQSLKKVFIQTATDISFYFFSHFALLFYLEREKSFGQ